MAKEAPWEIVEASFVAAASEAASLPAQLGVEIAFAGRSNVGKSSLLNTLMRRKNLVRTSSTPGCTRQINFFLARARDGALLHLVDLPGYGYAKRSKGERRQWAELIEGYLLRRDWLRVVVLLVDARRGLDDDERDLITLLGRRRGQPVALITVATKIDKVPKSKRRAVLAKLTGAGGIAIGTSAVEGDGVPELWRALRKAAWVDTARADADASPDAARPAEPSA